MYQEIFKPGEQISFTTDSALFPDVYQTKVLTVHPDRLDFHLAFHRGYLVLLPVGTKIRWLLPVAFQQHYLTSTVISRRTSDKVWSVTLPQKESSIKRQTRVLAVGSGKGGVGKTTFSINLALALCHCGQRVVLLDADIGMANVEVLLGLQSSSNLADVIEGRCTLSEIIINGPGGIRIIPGSTGISSLTSLNSLEFNRIVSGFADLESTCDILLLDTGAGLSELVLRFLESADEFLLLTNPEPHALMDGYALTKVLVGRNPHIKTNIVMNRCDSEEEAKYSTDKLILACEQFLNIKPTGLGWLPYDQLVTRSLKKKTPIISTHPHIDFSKNIVNIAKSIANTKGNEKTEKPTGLKAFWTKLKNSWLNA